MKNVINNHEDTSCYCIDREIEKFTSKAQGLYTHKSINNEQTSKKIKNSKNYKHAQK